MRLGPGSSIPRLASRLRARLAEEQDRIREYLQNDGFYEAKVTIKRKRVAPFVSDLYVSVKKGPAYTVGKIVVHNNKALTAERIRKIFHHDRVRLFGVGLFEARFNKSQLLKDIRAVEKLYHKHNYPAARVRTTFDKRTSFKRDTKTVEFAVIVNERRNVDVIFEGNKSVRSKELKQQLTFSEAGAHDDVEIGFSAEAVRRHYQSKGFFETSVTTERVRFQGVFEQIIFQVDEGPRMPVRRVDITGNKALSNAALREDIKTNVYAPVAFFGGGGGYATSLQLQQDRERILRHYAREGFADAQVELRVSRDPITAGNAAATAAAVAAHRPSKGVEITFNITEGPRTTVSKVQFCFAHAVEHASSAQRTGSSPCPENVKPLIEESVLRAAVQLRTGAPYRTTQLEDDTERLRRVYRSRGFPRAKVETRTERTKGARHQVIVTHTVFEDVPVRFGKVGIRGNFQTKAWVIRDELEYGEGKLLTLGRSTRGQLNLRNTGLFHAVKVRYLEREDPDQRVMNVIVDIQERETPTLSTEVAVVASSDRGAFVENDWKAPNIGGIGLRGSVRFQATFGQFIGFGDTFLSAEGQLAAPRWIANKLVGIRVRTDTLAFARLEETERFGRLITYGFSLAFSRIPRSGFFKDWVFSLGYNLRFRQRQVDLIRGAGPNDGLTKAPLPTLTSSIGPRIIIDKRKDSEGRLVSLSPRRGYKLEFRAKYAESFLLGDDQFLKLGISGQHFFELGKRLLFSNGIRYDHGIPLPLGQQALLPEVERFFAGGDTTVRGFEEDRLATESILLPLPPFVGIDRLRVLPAGGNIRFIHNFETEIELAQIGGVPLAWAVFLDTGLIANSLVDFSLRDLRHSAGLGLRVVLPVGSISFEWAIPLDPEPGDNPQGRFHFHIGVLF